MALIHVGIDDTDSKRGMCTTYVGAVALRRLEGMAEPVGYPKLIRLNPNCPYKTRGNCSIGFTLRTGEPGRVKRVVLRTGEELSEK
ncbi:MAG: hypothetical protein QXK27_03130 [Candidatus Hadarchaeales archaeon]